MTSGLVADIGGTNVRMAWARLESGGPRLSDVWTGSCVDFAGPEAALEAFLASTGARGVDRAVLAAAGPVSEGAVVLTNSGWRLDEIALAQAGFGRVRLVNDFAALALAATTAGSDAATPIGSVPARAGDGVRLALGPGTGFGVGAATPRPGGGWAPLAGEGGHVAFAPTDALEAELLRVLSRRWPRVSVERILSGPGLLSLHAALAEIEGRRVVEGDPAAVGDGALAGDGRCLETVRRFWAVLASTAGDFALAFGARGGVFLAGGVVDKLAPLLDDSAFRARFEAKGRYVGYMRAIPTARLRNRYAALLGAAAMLDEA